MLIATNFALCTAITYLALCRVTRMSADTRAPIRWAVSFMAAGAVAAAVAPLVWGMQVHPAMLVMEAGHVAFLIACKRLWAGGIPASFRTCGD